MSAGTGSWTDGLRLTMGTFTAVRVPPPRSIDRGVAGRSMLLAPVIGVLLGVSAGCVLFATRELYHSPWLPAALTLAFLALMTRGIHLDGLADTADALGAQTRQRGLTVMRDGASGPFGVAVLVFVLLLQTLALGEAVREGHGTQGIITACVVGRLAATLGCVSGIPAARPDGLGATVAGSVRRGVAGLVALLVVAASAVYGAWIDDDASRNLAALAVVAVAVGLGAAVVVLAVAVRRFGGITGDVLGAMVEVATLGTLLVFAR